jgi:hypothetical protein
MIQNTLFDLGPCCACAGLDASGSVRNIIMLNVKGTLPGYGWGCFVCGLSTDGAVAVICDECLESKVEIRFAVDGKLEDKKRIPRGELKEPHQHDMSMHPEEREAGNGSQVS